MANTKISYAANFFQEADTVLNEHSQRIREVTQELNQIALAMQTGSQPRAEQLNRLLELHMTVARLITQFAMSIGMYQDAMSQEEQVLYARRIV